MTTRIASVPTDHVYVRHLHPITGGGPTRLTDPTADGPAGARWWPPRVLDPAWLVEHAADFDVVHVHFGFDACTPAELRDWARTLRALGKPLVVTVHDLRNPHHDEPSLHERQLGELLAAADAVVTLTPGAAGEIRRRFGREAVVLPHPHVAGLDRVAAPRPTHDGFVVGVHCKSLRAGMDPLPVVETLAAVVPDLPGARLRVDVHQDVMDGGRSLRADALAARLRELAGEGRIDLVVGAYLADHESFLDYLASLDVSVLPYRHGTHSGWLEACHDLGTTVVAPTCGYYAEQRPVLVFDPEDPASLVTAVRLAHEDRPVWRATRADREAERAHLAAAHDELYRAVLTGTEVATCTS